MSTAHAASTSASWRFAGLAALCVGASLISSGCGSIGAATGAVAGVATGTFTSNPAIGFGVGVAVQAATDEAVNHYLRVMHTDQQNVIASIAGAMPVGETRDWRVKHTLPVENGHGQVRVVRGIASSLAICKEFAFSIIDGDKPGAKEDWYIASACQQDGNWKWASAEPAVERWGNLQ